MTASVTEAVLDLFEDSAISASMARKLPHRNLALEPLKKLLNDEIKSRSKKSLVHARSFTEMLENTIIQYQNRTIDAAQEIVLQQLAIEFEDNRHPPPLHASLQHPEQVIGVLAREARREEARDIRHWRRTVKCMQPGIKPTTA